MYRSTDKSQNSKNKSECAESRKRLIEDLKNIMFTFNLK